MLDNVKVGKQIALLRKNKGLTQEDIARQLNISSQAVSKWENGHTMPELSLLVALSELLGCTIDHILFPMPVQAANANFEHILLPYAPIADFAGIRWPRSMSKPAILSAVKLFMGLEKRRDAMNRQINDDAEYILQGAFSGISFGYSWGFDDNWEECLAIYGLTCEMHASSEYSKEEFVSIAVDHIRSGYPIIVIPKEYTDTILATGYSDSGRVLKGISFLDGDDEKNSVMSFELLNNYSEWYLKDSDLLLIKPGQKTVSVADKCREVLQKGYVLLSNKVRLFEQPLVGYGLVIYDNWCEELRKETNKGLTDIECMFPHIFIHYEGKLRVKQFLELCMHLIQDIDNCAVLTAISKYDEMLSICEKCMHEMLPKTPENAEEAGVKRQAYIGILQRCRGLEEEALMAISSFGGGDNHVSGSRI